MKKMAIQQTLADLMDQVEINSALLGLVKGNVDDPEKAAEIENLLKNNRRLLETAQTAMNSQESET